jgi:arabinofuranosyltransferase
VFVAGRPGARAWWLAAPWFLVPVLAHLLWRHSFYGAWLPNTWAVKGAAAPLRAAWSGPYLAAWVGGLGLVVWAPLLAWARRSDLPWLAAIAAHCGYVAWVGGDFMAYGRLLLPATALAGVGIAVLLARASGSLAAKLPRARVDLVAGLAAGAFLIGSGVRAHQRWRSDLERPEGWLDGKWEGVTAMDRFARTRIAAGAALRAAVPADTVIAVGAAGALPYTSRLPVVDVYGLVDPQLAREPAARLPADRARPGHVLHASPEYVRRRGATLWCHLGWVGHGTPPRARIPAAMRGEWTFGCVRTGAVPDPRSPGGTFDPGAYCCLRPQGVLETALPTVPARGAP